MAIALSSFDKKSFYDQEIAPLVEQLMDKCHGANLPCFISCCVSNDEKGSKYINDGHLPCSNRIGLTEDRFREYLMVNLGFQCQRKKDTDMVMIYDTDDDSFDDLSIDDFEAVEY